MLLSRVIIAVICFPFVGNLAVATGSSKCILLHRYVKWYGKMAAWNSFTVQVFF